MKKTALLLTTYNWPAALELLFKSLMIQKELPDEVIIADDGSGEETLALIEKFKKEISIPVSHVWHEDKGFRRSAILNKAIAGTTADYIIQIDGDCIMGERFIKDHVEFREKGVFLFGSRVNITKQGVAEVLEKKIFQFPFFSPHITKRTRNLSIPFLRNFYKKNNAFSNKVRGCNLSYWRKDFLEINGYNEAIEGWGREDSEMVLRLLNKDVQGKRIRYGGVIYHIYHPEKSKENLDRNTAIQEKTIQEKRISCEDGIEKYLNS